MSAFDSQTALASLLSLAMTNYDIEKHGFCVFAYDGEQQGVCIEVVIDGFTLIFGVFLQVDLRLGACDWQDRMLELFCVENLISIDRN